MTKIKEHVIDKIKSNKEFSKLDDETISECVEDATKIVETYDIPHIARKRAIYLYSCYLLSLYYESSSGDYKTVKVESATYTRFGVEPINNYWEEFNKLLDEFGLTKWKIKFF